MSQFAREENNVIVPAEEVLASFAKVGIPCTSKSEALLPMALYNQAFLIPQDIPNLSSTSVAAILVYNNALATHRHAILQSASGARHYYDQALMMYRETHSCMNGVNLLHSPAYLPIVAGVLYNMLVIHTELFRYDQARYLRQLLFSFLGWEGSLLMENDDGVFFHVHVSLSMMLDFGLAPCA